MGKNIKSLHTYKLIKIEAKCRVGLKESGMSKEKFHYRDYE
jgi:hypothetical protein